MDPLVNPNRKSLKDLPDMYLSPSDCCTTRNGLLYYTVVAGNTSLVIVLAHNNLRLHIMYKCHDAPTGGPRGREKTYFTVIRDFYCPRQYQFVRKSFVLAKFVNE